MIRSKASWSASLRNSGSPATVRLRTWETKPPGVTLARLGMATAYQRLTHFVNTSCVPVSSPAYTDPRRLSISFFKTSAVVENS